MHDDWLRALREARARHKPIFVDAWAPWCHSCLSMKAFVLSDPKLTPLADDFVWLSIDTEKDENAAFTKKFSNDSWPTLWVIEPERQTPILKWGGTTTTAELLTLLGAVAHGEADEGTVHFLRAAHEQADGELAASEKSYHAALAAVKEPSARGRAAEGLVTVLSSASKWTACVDEAAELAPALGPGTSRAVVLVTGLGCANEGDVDGFKLRAMAARAVQDPDPRTAADDRSGLFQALVESAKKAGDDSAVKATAARWATFLEAEASSAMNSQARAVFDPHRLDAYIALGEPGRAVPMLEQSERDFPSDYNPPARLAKAHLKLKELETAKADIDRAAAKVYGPRSLSVFLLAADIAKERGRPHDERAALEQAISRTASVQLYASQKALRDRMEKRLAELRGSATL